MIHRFVFIAIGLLVFLSGADIFNRQAFYYFGVNVKIENSTFVAILVMIFGVLFLLAGFKKNFSLTKKEKYYKCSRCGMLISEEFQKNLTCPKCGSRLEDLHGFYERHPELKDN
jgi:uncharacterized paraquat-inducible protein A